MPRPSQDPVAVLFGSAKPVAAPVAGQLLLDREPNQWILTLTATGGDVTITTAGAVIWWFVTDRWVRAIRNWPVPDPVIIEQDDRHEDLMRARVGATGVYLQLPLVAGPGTLSVTVTPVRGGS